jgi:hypothetical protein
MERIYHLGGATAAGVLSVAPVDHPMTWAWLLVAAEAAICVLLRQQSQSRTKPVPVLANALQPNARRPIRRAPPRSP